MELLLPAPQDRPNLPDQHESGFASVAKSATPAPAAPNGLSNSRLSTTLTGAAEMHDMRLTAPIIRTGTTAAANASPDTSRTTGSAKTSR